MKNLQSGYRRILLYIFLQPCTLPAAGSLLPKTKTPPVRTGGVSLYLQTVSGIICTFTAIV